MNNVIKQTSELLVSTAKTRMKGSYTKASNLYNTINYYSVNTPYQINKNLILAITEEQKILYCFSYDGLVWFCKGGEIECVDSDNLSTTSAFHVELAKRVYNSNDWVAEIRAIKEEL